MKRFLLLMTLLCGADLFSQDWREIAIGNDSKYYYKPNNDKTGWIKEVSEKLVYYSANTDKSKKIIDGYQISLYKFDCSEKQIGILQMTTYSKSGNVLKTLKINEYLVEMNYVIPDSIGEGMLDSFCYKE